MPRIVDADGAREITDEEIAELRVDADRGFDAFWLSLEWHPIADYDPEGGPSVILRDNADLWNLGYWGMSDDPHQIGASLIAWDVPVWRHTQDWQAGHPIAFEPTRFALVDDDWAATLAED